MRDPLDALSLPNIRGRVFETPLLIEQGKLRDIVAVLEAKIFAGDLAPRAAGAAALGPEQRNYALAAGGVAVIDISGTLVHRGANLRAHSGLTGYEAILSDFRQARDDPGVRAIALRIDSAGGEVAGLWQLVDEIYQSSARFDGKPVWAVADAMAYSAAYAIAAAADRLLVLPEGGVGSIGVIWARLDASEYLQNEGFKFDLLFRGARKADGHVSLPLNDELRAKVDARLDDLYAGFTERVARFRGLEQAAVAATEAEIFTAQDAVAGGLADAVATFEEALETLSAEQTAAPTVIARPAATQTRQEKTMSKRDDDTQVAPEDQVSRADADAAAETMAAARAAEAVTGERERIGAIINAEEAAGRETLARHFAFDTTMSAEDAIAALKAAPAAAADGGPSALDRHMANNPNPEVDPDADDPDPEGVAAVAARIVNAGATLRGENA